MKKLIKNYTFVPGSNEIGFNDYTSIKLENVLLITNVNYGVFLYNFSDPDLGGTVDDNILTLTKDCSAFDSNDALQIWYDDDDVASTVSKQDEMITLLTVIQNQQTQLNNLTEGFYELLSRLDFLPTVRGSVGDLRVTLTSTALSSLATLSNQAMMGGLAATTQIKDLDNLLFISGNLNNVN